MSSQLINVINYIRDILRSEGITGMDSLDHCIIFMVFRMFDVSTCNKLNINIKNTFDNFIKQIANKDYDDDIYKNFVSRSSVDDSVLFNLVNKFKFTTLKFKLQKPKNLVDIIKKIKDLDINLLSAKCDIVGIIYELHLKSGAKGSGMRDLGQFYTNRQVINFMIELCNPTVINGVIEQIVDPTCGTAGFLSMAIKYLNNKFTNIDWNLNKSNIYGYDIDEHIVNLAILNLFMETGEIFIDSITKQDTLKQDFNYDGNMKFKIILANEPMGIKNIKYEQCCSRIKDLKFNGTKAEPLFLQLFMQSLDDNGRCAVIVPDGVLFNDSKLHFNTRKYLIDNFNLQKVIALNDDFFLNTGVKTSILFFSKDKIKTKQVEFSELKLNDNKLTETKIITVNCKDIKTANYSLFVNKYTTVEITKIKDMEYKKLGDICTINYGTRIKRKEVEVLNDYNGTKYPCYGGGDISFYMKEFNREGQNIIISRFGVSKNCVRIINGNLWLNDSGFTIHSTDNNKLLTHYLGYYCYIILQSKIFELSMGACQKNLQIDEFKNIEIPIPTLAVQEAIIEQLDVIKESIEESQSLLIKYRKIINYYVNCYTRNDVEEFKLGDICDFDKIIKHDTSYGKEHGNYKFHTGGIRTDLYCDTPDTAELHIIQNRTNGSGKCNLIIDNNFSCAKQTVVYRVINDINNITTKFTYYYLNANILMLENGYRGINHKNISKEYIKDINIKIPSKEIQEKIVNYCDNLSDTINNIEQQIKDSKKLMKRIMNNYLNLQHIEPKDSDKDINTNETESINSLNSEKM